MGDFLVPLFQVLLIDLVLAADNAIVIGSAASGLSKHERRRAIQVGLIGAFVMRAGFAVVTVQLLQVVGLLLAGGLLLLWVAWKMFRDCAPKRTQKSRKTLRSAITQIALADLSMSLDNILAVAGAARENMVVLVVGRALSILLMGTVAGQLATLIENYRWVAYLGVATVLWVAGGMIFHGVEELVR